MLDVKFKKLSDTAHVFTYGSVGSAGADMYADIQNEIKILPGETVIIPTNIAVELPAGYVGLIFARSGLSCKEDLAPATKVSVIDSDYRNGIGVPLHNHGDKRRTVTPQERIAQYVIVPVEQANFVEAVELTDTDRGMGGFGSTGK